MTVSWKQLWLWRCQATDGVSLLSRLYWDNGGLVMLTSALIMSCGALAVALIDDRVPVFEIVVGHPSSLSHANKATYAVLMMCTLLSVGLLLTTATVPIVAYARRDHKLFKICGAGCWPVIFRQVAQMPKSVLDS